MRSLVSLTALSVIFPCILALCQQAGPVEKVSGAGKSIIVHASGSEHTYDFEDDLQLYEIGETELLFQRSVANSLYLLLHVKGSTRGGGRGYCGAGEEEYLIWLDLDLKNWDEDDYKVELIASCAVSIGSVHPDPYQIEKGKLTAEYADGRDNVRKTLVYDSAKPEKGWVIHEQPVTREK
jgi:hypothetical protein